MTSYDDAATLAEMHDDCRACGTNLGLERELARAARRATRPAPSILAADQVEAPKQDVQVSQAAARLAAALHFHLE
ncbi:MAG: hypothetical protein CMH83_08790 [Nocardioides sp.]|nr:hypothetical protein [Nocardioides sp.]